MRSEVAKGFRQRRFFDLPDRDKRRHTEADGSGRRAGLPPWRLARGRAGRQAVLSQRLVGVALPAVLAPGVDRPTTTTSLDRLDTECGGA
jgi:hypothetical protein